LAQKPYTLCYVVPGVEKETKGHCVKVCVRDAEIFFKDLKSESRKS